VGISGIQVVCRTPTARRQPSRVVWNSQLNWAEHLRVSYPPLKPHTSSPVPLGSQILDLRPRATIYKPDFSALANSSRQRSVSRFVFFLIFVFYLYFFRFWFSDIFFFGSRWVERAELRAGCQASFSALLAPNVFAFWAFMSSRVAGWLGNGVLRWFGGFQAITGWLSSRARSSAVLRCALRVRSSIPFASHSPGVYTQGKSGGESLRTY